MKNSNYNIRRIYRPVIFSLLAMLIGFGCSDTSQKQQKMVDDLNMYVQAHKDSIDLYVHENWQKLDSEFTAKKSAVERDTDHMTESMKASYYDAVRNWEGFQNQYAIRRSEQAKVSEMDTLRRSLALDGVRPDFTDLGSALILEAYGHFVNTVKANKDQYTKEQWTVVNVSWKALNGRKRELEKDITAATGAKITKLQLEYTGIKALNRPLAENP